MAETGKVLELVVFKLNQGVTREQFLATDDAVSQWISEQPGFISHELLYDADGDHWVELAWWKTIDDAAAKPLTSETCAPMFSLIDEQSSLMLHAESAITPVRAHPARTAA